MIETDFTILSVTRDNIKKLIKSFSIEQLNEIPSGMNNNLIWNLGHIIVTQQLLCYKMSGLPMNIENSYVEKYRKGTKPNPQVPNCEKELDHLLELLDETQNQTKLDYSNGLFKDYQSYTTSYNMTLNSIEDAIRFNNIHEGMHFGTCLALKNLI